MPYPIPHKPWLEAGFPTSNAGYSTPARLRGPGMYQVTQFKNGLKVATAEMPHMTSVSVGLWVGVGSRYEPAPLNGVCHFIEHLLFKGTKKRSAREISQAVEGIGGYLNAFTSEEVTCFHARAGHDRFHELLDVLLDMLLNSRFDPADIAKEREVIKEEIAMYLDEPQHQVQELLNATLWPGQPLGRPITGTSKTLNTLTRVRLLDHLRTNYVAGNTLVVAAGRLKHRQVVRAVERYAPRFHTAVPPRFSTARGDQQRPKIRLFTKRTEQTQIALGIRTCSRQDERRYALRLLNTILGENSSSRLFQVLREDRGLAYSIYSSPSFFGDTGDLVISAGLDTGNLTKALRLIVRELRRLREAAPSVAELRRARDYVIGQMDLGLESADNQMNWLGEQLLGYGKILPPARLKRRLRKVTPGDIRAVARDFLRPERLNLALVSPLKSARTLVNLLR
jgi:predicted Zn-dependent peptidase